MLRTGQLHRAPPRPRDLARRRGPRYRGPWRLPGPDSHRLAAVSLSLGYTVASSFRSLRRPSYWTHIPAESRPAAAAHCPIGSVAAACKVASDRKSASQLTSLAGTQAARVGPEREPHRNPHTAANATV